MTDFGFANQFKSEADDLMATTCGSPCYAAPELVVNTGLYAGSAVDIWSCGVILYAMLCGFLPFDDDPSNPESDNINQLYKYILSTHVIFPAHVDKDARDLMEKILVTDPAKRCSLDYIINHPWLTEYHEFLKLDISQLKNRLEKSQGKPILNEKPGQVINASISAVIPRKPVGSGVSRSGARSPRISLLSQDRFAPVANDKYKRDLSQLRNKPTEASNPKTSSTFMNFAIRKTYPNATNVEQPNKSSKFSTFITRKPVPRMDILNVANDSNETIGNDETTVAPTVTPEKSLSSPQPSNDNKYSSLVVRRNQRGGTDKFLSFFSGTKVSQAPMSKDAPEQENNHATAEHAQTKHSEAEQASNKEGVYSESDVSTISVSVPSLALSEDTTSESTHDTPEPAAETHIESSNLETIDENAAENESQPNDEASHVASSAVSSHKEAPSLSTISRNSSRNHYSDIRSIRSSSTNERDLIQPEISSSTKFSNAVGESGRKAIAAVRRSMNRKTRGRSIMQNQHQLDTIPDEDANVTTPHVSFKPDTPPKLMASISESPEKKGSETASKKSGMKMMGWIKKRSQGKLAQNHSSQVVLTNVYIGHSKAEPQQKPIVSESTVKLPPKIKTEKVSDYSIVSSTAKSPIEKNEQPQEEPKKTIPGLSEQSIARRRNRAHSGNDASLKKLFEQDKSSSLDQKIQLHQGAIDRNALTSQAPALIVKDVLRILRILGIETKLEGDFVIRCHRQKSKKQTDEEDTGRKLEPIYGDASIDNGDEIRFAVEICRFENLPGLYIVDVRRLKGNAWAYKFLYHKLIDLLYSDKNGYL